MFASNLFAVATALAAMASPAAAVPTAENAGQISTRQAASSGYAYLGCMAGTQSPANVFVNPNTTTSFGNGVALNTKCASLCRSYNTQYYATVDYMGQCSCGDTLNFALTYSTSSTGCQLCGGTFRDENYVTGPGVCGDYYYGAAALYSLDF